MNWLRDNEFAARPLVAVEDHVYHISELLRTILNDAPILVRSLTVVCLDRQGPDTDAAVAEWLADYPGLQIAFRTNDETRFEASKNRVHFLAEAVFQDQNAYCTSIASLVRNRGMLLQDIELETLEFVPRDRWWQSTMLASTVRGIVGERAPRCAFISNKRGYEATFGAELLAAGHDPRDVLNKYDIERVVVPFLNQHLATHFPWELEWADKTFSEPSSTKHVIICREPAERHEIEANLDVVLWPSQDQSCEIGGRAFADLKKRPIVLSTDGNECVTWTELVMARLEDQLGVEVQNVGQRVAPAGALRAETTNAAARHIHALRKRLESHQDIITVQGHYRLREDLVVGVARCRPPATS